MILSILVCSLEERKDMWLALMYDLKSQITALGLDDQVEVLADIDNRQITTGAKRNRLLKQASGVYSVFCDDDDQVSMEYVDEIVEAAKQNPDCITFNGEMSTNGKNPVDFDIALNNPYKEATVNGKQVYLRWPNHIVPIKREIALQIQFPDKYMFEDYEWSVKLRESGLLKTEVKIDKKLYHYRFRTGKK